MSARLLLPAALLAAGGITTGALLLPHHLAAATPPAIARSAAPAAPASAPTVVDPLRGAGPAAAAHSMPSTRALGSGGATGTTGRSEPAPKPSPISTHAASRVVDAFSAAGADLPAASPPEPAALREIVSGSALRELQAEQLELKATGESIRGAARATDVRLLSSGTTDGTRTARVSACIDSSDVQRLDAEGKPVSTTVFGSQRALNLYDLRQDGSTWLVVSHSFPADSAC